MVKFTRNKADTSGPSSAIGIMRFFDSDSKSPKLNPYFVIGAIALIVIAIIAVKLMSRA